MTDRDLINMAFSAAARSYAPYSRFHVGAALECSDGTIFTGCNVENVALGESICAERTAVLKAVSERRRDFKRIAVAAESTAYCMPCGSCLQVLREFSPDIEVLCARSGGGYVSYRLSELLPVPFAPSDDENPFG